MSLERYIKYVLNYNQSKFPHYKSKIYEEPQLVKFGSCITVAGDDIWLEKHGVIKILVSGNQYEYRDAVFCRLLFINGVYYAFALSGQNYYVRGFDQNWQFTGFEKKLTPNGERDVDQDIAFNGKYIYTSPWTASRIIWAKVRKFDLNFNLVKQTPMLKADPNEFPTDPNIAIVNGKICLGTEYRENGNWRRNRPPNLHNLPPNSEVARATHLRVFDKNLNLLEERDLVANVNGAVVPHQYWGMGASQLYVKGYNYLVVVSPIGNVSYFDRGESIGARQLFVLKFDDNYNFIESIGPLTDTENDNYWPTGSCYEDGRYYISYTCRKPGEGRVLGPKVIDDPGTFSLDLGNIRLSIFDEDFSELETIEVTNFKVKPGFVTDAAHRSNIFKMGTKLYVTYDTCRKSFLQELIIQN